MLIRPILAACSLLAAFVPSPQRYRVEVRGTAGGVKVTDGPDGSNTAVETRTFATRALLTVTLADTVAGRAMGVTVDSLRNDPPRNVGGPDAAAPGTGSWHGVLRADGTLASFTPGTNSVETRSLDDLVATLIPRVPARAKPGDSWVDTTQFTVLQSEGPHTTRVVTRYRAAGTDKVDGADALRVEGEFTLSRSSKFNGRVGQVAIETTSDGSVLHRLAADGTLLDSRIVRRSKSTMTLPSAAPVATEGTDTTTITLVR